MNRTYLKMMKRYGPFKLANFSQRLLDVNFEDVVLASEQSLMSEYGFLR